jgi:hypothetical protein
VLRRLLLAVLLCLAAWTVERTVGDAAPAVTPTIAAAAAASETSGDTRHSDDAWSAAQPLKVNAEGFSPTRDQHADSVELPRISHREHGRLTTLRRSWRQPTPSARPHLHDIPLLI